MLPSTVSYIFEDPSIIGTNKLVQETDEKWDQDLLRGRIAAETLKKPMTFFEAVEALRMPKGESNAADMGKKGKASMTSDKKIEPKWLPHHLSLVSIDLSGYKSLRFSKMVD